MTNRDDTPAGVGDRRYLVLLSIGLAVVMIVIGSVVGLLTGPDADDWYTTLTKSELNPPGWVFGVVWPVLYGMMGVATAILWVKKWDPRAEFALILMGFQLVLNYCWSFIFFNTRLTELALWWILAITMCVFVMVPMTFKVSKLAGFLLLPYLLWLFFAAYLSGTIFTLN